VPVLRGEVESGALPRVDLREVRLLQVLRTELAERRVAVAQTAVIGYSGGGRPVHTPKTCSLTLAAISPNRFLSASLRGTNARSLGRLFPISVEKWIEGCNVDGKA